MRCFVICAVFSGMSVIMSGCTPYLGYSIRVANASNRKLVEADVRYSETSFGAGTLNPGVEKSHHIITKPVPAKATVEWRTVDDGELHRWEVPIPESISGRKRFEGTIVFTIQPGGNGVSVAVEPE